MYDACDGGGGNKHLQYFGWVGGKTVYRRRNHRASENEVQALFTFLVYDIEIHF